MHSKMDQLINIKIENLQGNIQEIQVPSDINLSLMEVLKASEFNVAATCGGMALCATCHVEVKEGADKLPSAGDAELDMLDTLPRLTSTSRLACQIRVSQSLNGLLVKVLEG